MHAQAPTLRSAATGTATCPSRRRDDVALTELLDSYESHGGVAAPDEIISRMRPYWRQPISILAKWIVGRKVVSFDWRSQILLPIFQFERPRMTPHQGVAEAAFELSDMMDDQGLATWFVAPSEWLEQAAPADLVLSDPGAVVGAARRVRQALMARRLTA